LIVFMPVRSNFAQLSNSLSAAEPGQRDRKAPTWSTLRTEADVVLVGLTAPLIINSACSSRGHDRLSTLTADSSLPVASTLAAMARRIDRASAVRDTP
jgi:hypothetical protein